MNLQMIVTKLKTLSDVQKAFLLSLAIGASSILSFKTPFMPVPWIVQNQIALVIGYFFGARIGFIANCFFLIEGACGAPFFSFGRSGFGMLIGSTGGYLIAYPFASALAGLLKDKLGQKSLGIFSNLIASNLLIYTIGVLQLSFFVGIKKAMMFGLIPFIALDVLKTVLATFFIRQKQV